MKEKKMTQINDLTERLKTIRQQADLVDMYVGDYQPLADKGTQRAALVNLSDSIELMKATIDSMIEELDESKE